MATARTRARCCQSLMESTDLASWARVLTRATTSLRWSVPMPDSSPCMSRILRAVPRPRTWSLPQRRQRSQVTQSMTRLTLRNLARNSARSSSTLSRARAFSNGVMPRATGTRNRALSSKARRAADTHVPKFFAARARASRVSRGVSPASRLIDVVVFTTASRKAPNAQEEVVSLSFSCAPPPTKGSTAAPTRSSRSSSSSSSRGRRASQPVESTSLATRLRVRRSSCGSPVS
mmetsp:Transcript_24543/g.75814  ORF Transcript_24543/g.75814 Transcript_24543/m.75814 type:complete len:233 (-) Transcript_24543:623-1321(-)